MDKHEKPSYYSIMTADVRYDKRLKANEKILYSEITALTQANGICWASNEYFANLYDVDKATVSRWVNHLKKLGYIDVKLIYKENSKEIEKRIIAIKTKPIDEIVDGVLTKKSRGYRQKNQGGIDEKVIDNITSINNTSINNIYSASGDAQATSKNKNESDLNDRFNKLWAMYPNKKGKQKAFKSYKKAIKDGETDLNIANGIRDYVLECKAKGTSKEYMKHGSTFFFNKSWTDEFDLPIFEDKSNIDDAIANSWG